MSVSTLPAVPETMVERFVWSVSLDDGAIVHEWELVGNVFVHHSFTEIDVDRVTMLVMGPNLWIGAEGPIFSMECDRDAGIRPVMFRRVAINVESGAQQRYHVFGTERDVGGGTIRSLLHIDNTDGQIVVVISPTALDA